MCSLLCGSCSELQVSTLSVPRLMIVVPGGRASPNTVFSTISSLENVYMLTDLLMRLRDTKTEKVLLFIWIVLLRIGAGLLLIIVIPIGFVGTMIIGISSYLILVTKKLFRMFNS